MKKTNVVMPIGIWLRDNKVEAVWLEKPQWARNKPQINPAPEAHSATLPLMPQVNLPQRIMREMTVPIKPQRTNLLFISAILPNFVWERSIVVPQKLSDQECAQQCQHLLASELPVSLDKVWFDYHATPLKQGTLIEMSAVLIEHAKAHMEKFMPFKIHVLDSVSHALSRAFNHIKSDLPNDVLYLYADDDYCIAFQQKGYDFNILQNSGTDLTALFEQYCSRFDTKPENVCAYVRHDSEKHQQEFAQRGWIHCQTDLPMIALGLALWNVHA
ncbi:type IV pilus assembly PilM-like protein [Pasteurella langaaensis DSM 22999]|uniref:Type IV pilus assembly PilM-like protein n=1 Tax=Alitibacter langaaensis DSM 22999 TaxID=1122935 RepID=A0A2U0TGL9_9PAST|nr:pilus assembly protein PilM [Pasteurella langaaensis]PVX42727.1 type IV pilus assembly PilM-like protein [Pasteurella langaaensis DSM 22999]